MQIKAVGIVESGEPMRMIPMLTPLDRLVQTFGLYSSGGPHGEPDSAPMAENQKEPGAIFQFTPSPCPVVKRL
jgi:hypothetical protein